MPELPEVQTVVSTLQYQLGNAVIKDVHVYWDRIIAYPGKEEFINCLKDQQFLSYGRKGKYLIFTLTDYILVVHLRMEGKFYVFQQENEPFKHTHVVFDLQQGQLHYHDVRKFGRMWLYRKGEPLLCLSKLGLEPWDDSLNAQYLKKYCNGLRTSLKQQLLDQSMICGIGNIYADEICYAVKMNPAHPARLISYQKWDEIIDATRNILSKAIEAGGTTIRSYTSSLGVNGLFQLSLRVHDRKSQACFECGTQVLKTTLAGRGTYYCPQCQKQKRIAIAITGTIGSGKSTVTKTIGKHGFETISCDDLNSEILQLDSTKEALGKLFGCESSQVDKDQIRRQIFNNTEMKERVEHCLHKLIGEQIKNWYENCSGDVVFVEVPLLFEANWYPYFDGIIVVKTDEEVLKQRLVEKRGISLQQAEKYIGYQWSTEQKCQLADWIIDNNGTEQNLVSNVEKILESAIKL